MADFVCVECERSGAPLRVYAMSDFRRHVAVDHGGDVYLNYQCGICKAKLYDVVHFDSHLKARPECRRKVEFTGSALPMRLVKSLEALILGMKREIRTASVGVDPASWVDDKNEIKLSVAPISNASAKPLEALDIEVINVSDDDDEEQFTSFCQMCREVGGCYDRYDAEERIKHTIAHIRGSPRFATMSGKQLRRHPNFTKVLDGCFKKDGYDGREKLMEA